MRSDPRSLVQRLTPTARRHLESAVTAAALAQHGSLTPEHVLRGLLADAKGDVSALASEAERSAMAADVDRMLARAAKSGARPSLSDTLVRWLERAWLLASLEWQDDAIRTGALFVAYLELAATGTETPPSFARLSIDRVRAARASMVGASPESAEARARSESAAGEPPSRTALDRFTTSFTARARRGELDAVLGRERETRQVIDILCRRRKNNPVLVGEPGVGKTAIVEGLALAIARGDVPGSLREVDLLALDMGLLEAGASARGEMEARLTSVIREVKESPKPIILFIDEAHTLVGAQPNGGTDAANLLKPALARGELRTIAATTFREHKKYFEKDAALERRFQKVSVEEPDEATAVTMLRGLVSTYERAHGVRVRSEAVEAAVRLSKRYVAGRQLPDSCVDVLDTTLARVRGSQVTPPLVIERLDGTIAALERETSALERERLDGSHGEAITALRAQIARAQGERAELHARWMAQREALERLLGARRSLSEVPEDGSREPERRQREIDVRVAQAALDSACGEAPLVSADVDARAVAATIESWTGVPLGDVLRARAETMQKLELELERRVLGQTSAMRAVADGLRIAHTGLRAREAPAGVFLLVGPSGVGKTETAHAIADLLYGGDRFLTTINLSEYQEKHTVSRLVGSPPGYVGYGEGGKLTEAVRLRPHSVVLLDECEKADLEVMNVFYQLLDRGVLADGEGRIVDFRNTVILLTSNLASDRIAELVRRGATDARAIEDDIRPTLSAHFAPALLGRMRIVPYLPLNDDALSRIVDLEMARVTARVTSTHGLALRFDTQVRAQIVSLARDPAAGVRHLRAGLERRVLGPLAMELLAPRDPHVAAIDVTVDGSGQLAFQWSAR